ncbi:MAG: hydrogen peroxide-inducible genes activator [Gammaproteobacteria bacterium]|nr:hydrogen peroxide-inducible genes activator [Gammaproteobacteria bacterium]
MFQTRVRQPANLEYEILNITLKQLRYYLVAAKYISLRQAARELKISQPSLSAQIQKLEETLGIELFERKRKGVTLTPLGRDLLKQAQQAVNSAESIIDAANFASKGPSGTFRLGASPTLGPYALPWILPEVHKKYGGVKFFVREEVPDDLAEGLYNGRFDLIMTTLPLKEEGITVMPLFREPLYLVLNRQHPLAKHTAIEGSQLAGQEILALEEHHLLFRQVEDLCKQFNAELLRDYEGTSLDSIRQMVYMEMGLAFLPALYIRSEIKDRDELTVLSVAGEFIYRQHALVWRDTSPLRVFYRELGEFFREIVKRQFGKDVEVLEKF